MAQARHRAGEGPLAGPGSRCHYAQVNENDLRAEVERLGPWHHDVELVPGVRTSHAPLSQEKSDQRTPTTYRPEYHVARIVESLFPAGLEGRSFLDCACNGGGHSLTAARHGAGRLFGFDARQHWVDQANFLKRFAPHPDIAFATAELDALPSLGVGRFDVTLFSGIFYHLPDPVAGLKIAADHTNEFLILNTAAKWAPYPGLQLSLESATEKMSGVDRLAWLPTGHEVLREILAWCGFPHSRLEFDRATAKGWSRIEIVAARDAARFAHYDSIKKEARPLRPAARPRLLRRIADAVRR